MTALTRIGCGTSTGFVRWVAAAIITAATAFSLQAASTVRDLDEMLRDVKEVNKVQARADRSNRKMQDLQVRLVSERDVARRTELFEEYKDAHADRLKLNYELHQAIKKAEASAAGISGGEVPSSLVQTVESLHKKQEALTAAIQQRELRLRKYAIDGADGPQKAFAKITLSAANAHKQKTAAIAKKLERIGTGAGPGWDLGSVREILSVLKENVALEEYMLQWDFAVTSELSEVNGYFGELKKVIEGLMGENRDYREYLKGQASSSVQSMNTMIQLIDRMARENFALPDMPSDEEIEEWVTAMEEYVEEATPYEAAGFTVYFDAGGREEWYVLDDNFQRQYLPAGPEADTNAQCRLKDDGYVYDESPYLETPRQVTFTKKWWLEEAVVDTETVETPEVY